MIGKKTFNSKTESILSKINKTEIPKLPITGDDLLKKGVPSGKKVGEILKKIEKKWIENNFHIDKEEMNLLIKKNF